MQWIDIVQTIGIVSSILIGAITSWLVYRQTKAQTRQIRSSTDAMIVAQVDEINRLLFEHPEVFPGLEESYPEAGPGEKGDRRYHLMHLILNNFEQVFHQHNRYDYIDNTRWDTWNTRIMTAILKKPYAIGHWEAIGWQYPEDFREFIERKKGEKRILGSQSLRVHNLRAGIHKVAILKAGPDAGRPSHANVYLDPTLLQRDS